jgi:AbrB family looped-hinge helix DNA binding protein
MVVALNVQVDDAVTARPTMAHVKLSSKFQIVIPDDVRKQLDLQPGQAFQVWARDGQIVAVPVRPLSEAFGMFPGLDTSDPRDHEDRL